jgi:hypothetical protein
MAGHEPKGRYTSFESVLHQLVHEALDAAILKHSVDLGTGSARKDSAVDTAAAYHEALGAIRALREAQKICHEVAKQLARDG